MVKLSKSTMHDLQDGVNVIGYFHGLFGLGESARQVVACLQSQSIPYSLVSADFLVEGHRLSDNIHYQCEKEGRYPINLFCIDCNAVSPFIAAKKIKSIKNHYNILLYFWETNVIPKKDLKILKALDEVWVSSYYIRDILRSYIKTPIFHHAQPVELNFSKTAPSKDSFGLKDKFTFLFCFDFLSVFERKNPLAIVDAFQKAFPDKKNVQLVIKSQNGANSNVHLNKCLKYISKDSRIKWIDESISQDRRYDLINSCDCYVSLHRSEGFGLTMAEAMLLEKPVIATGFSGNLDFMNDDNSCLCGYKLVKVGPNIPIYPAEGLWADVNIDEAASWMRMIYTNPCIAKEKGQKGKEYISTKHTIESVGKLMAERIRHLYANSKAHDMPYKTQNFSLENRRKSRILNHKKCNFWPSKMSYYYIYSKIVRPTQHIKNALKKLFRYIGRQM